jgi:hypothetical protein
MVDFVKLENKFMGHVFPEPMSGCWLWTGSRSVHGYGNFWHNKKCMKAHRVSYLIANHTLDDSLDVMHSCDNPCCVNPAHLSQGTTKQNIHDMWKKGRGVPSKGEANAKAELTEDDVHKIRLMAEMGYKTREILKKFDVCASTVRRVVTKKSWSHI